MDLPVPLTGRAPTIHTTRTRLTVGLLATALAAGVGAGVPTAPAQAAPLGALLFEDDFTGPAGSLPDPGKWEDHSVSTYNSSAAFGNIEPGDNETLNGAGQLVIPAVPGAGSAIRTGAKFGFQYGTMSAWIKNPAQQGYWPAFWSLNNNPDGTDVFPIGEVDAMEFYSTWPEAYHAIAHTWTGNSATEGGSPDNYCPGAGLTSGYNKYSATIEPGKVSFALNDQPCGVAYTKEPGKSYGFGPDVTRPNWLILNLANDTRSGAEVVAPTQPAQMLVDRVEVRALPGEPAPVVPPAATAVTTGGTYELANACGGKLLEVPAGSGYARTGTDVDAARQRWTVLGSDSGFVRLRNAGTGKALSLAWTSTADGTPLTHLTDNGSPNADWRLVDLGGGLHQIVNRHSGKAVDVQRDSAAARVGLEQRTADATCGQRWRFTRV